MAHLKVMSSHREFRSEYVDIPLSSIESFKSRTCFVMQKLNPRNLPWSPVDVICGFTQGEEDIDWRRCWIRSVDFSGITPQVSVCDNIGDPSREIDVTRIFEVRLVNEPIMHVAVFGLPLGIFGHPDRKVFVATVNLRYNTPHHYRNHWNYQEFAISGYTRCEINGECMLEAVLMTTNWKTSIPHRYVLSLNFQRWV
jgi:hypothetical protein